MGLGAPPRFNGASSPATLTMNTGNHPEFPRQLPCSGYRPSALPAVGHGILQEIHCLAKSAPDSHLGTRLSHSYSSSLPSAGLQDKPWDDSVCGDCAHHCLQGFSSLPTLHTSNWAPQSLISAENQHGRTVPASKLSHRPWAWNCTALSTPSRRNSAAEHRPSHTFYLRKRGPKAHPSRGTASRTRAWNPTSSLVFSHVLPQGRKIKGFESWQQIPRQEWRRAHERERGALRPSPKVSGGPGPMSWGLHGSRSRLGKYLLGHFCLLTQSICDPPNKEQG